MLQELSRSALRFCNVLTHGPIHIVCAWPARWSNAFSLCAGALTIGDVKVSGLLQPHEDQQRLTNESFLHDDSAVRAHCYTLYEGMPNNRCNNNQKLIAGKFECT